MATSSSRQAVDLLLGAMFSKRSPNRHQHSFRYSEPGTPPSLSCINFEVNFDDNGLIQAALFARRNAAPYLKTISVSEVQKTLTEFVKDHFWILGDMAWDSILEEEDIPYSIYFPEEIKIRLSEAISKSTVYIDPRHLFTFPLIPVSVKSDFDCDTFFLTGPNGLNSSRLPSGHIKSDLQSKRFPPFARWKSSDKRPSSWLGVWSSTREIAKRNRAVVLGAIALLPHNLERYMFSMRDIFGGYCIFDKSLTMASSDPHTPKLAENIIIDGEDCTWLTILADKISSPEKTNKRQMRALEYFYRAWVPDPTRRFPTLFAALDAIYGDAGRATQSVIEAIGPIMGSAYDYDRLKLLLGLRASVIHGGAPNVYESGDYHRYYEKYEKDATRDLEFIVARCLQIVIFCGAMRERPHTYAAILKQKTGRDI